jgi:hypothetical protein
MRTQRMISISKQALLGFLMIMSLQVFSQSVGTNNNTNTQQSSKEKIQAQKVAFISQDLQLTPSVAEKFWPLYNEFNSKKDEYAKTKRELEKNARKNGIDQLTDKQAQELIDAELNFEQNVLDLKKEYVEKYKAVIGINKTVKFFQSEKKFNNYLLKQLRGTNKTGNAQ